MNSFQSQMFGGGSYDCGVLRSVERWLPGGRLSAAHKEILMTAMDNVSLLGNWDVEDDDEAQRNYLAAVHAELEMIRDMDWDDRSPLRRDDTSRADAEAVYNAFGAAYTTIEEAA